MNVNEYEIEAEKFAEANREWNRLQRKARDGSVPQDELDAAELKFLRAERAHKAAYAAHSAASPDTSEEITEELEGGAKSRRKLTAEELAARDDKQLAAELDYWPAMRKEMEAVSPEPAITPSTLNPFAK